MYDSSKQGTKIASFTKSDGDQTIEITGDYTSVGIRSNKSALYLSKITLEWEIEGGGLQSPDFEFSTTAASATLGEAFTPPTLTNTSDGTVSYASSNESVATVDADGAVTILAGGSTTITASVPKTDNFYAAEASYVLMVEDPNAPVYVLVTSPLQLVPGESYLIANASTGMVMGYQKSSNRHAVSATFSADKKEITSVTLAADKTDQTNVYEFVLGKEGSLYTFYDALNSGYLYAASSGSNHLKTSSTLSDNAEAAIDFAADGTISVVFQGSNSRNTMRYNSGSDIFSCYESGQQPVQLYHKVIDKKENLYTALTAEEDGVFYGTVYSDKAYVVPTGLEAGIITDAADNGVLTVDYRYTAGTTVPAKTAVLLKGTATTQQFVVAAEAGTPPENNLLHGVDGIDSEGNMYVGEDYKYYYLAYNKDTGKDLGFYYGAADGAAFAYKAPYAFLAIPKSVSLGVKGFRFSDNATAIEGVTTSHSANAPIFDLSGRRVKSVAKGGIYIQNGKKFIVK